MGYMGRKAMVTCRDKLREGEHGYPTLREPYMRNACEMLVYLSCKTPRTQRADIEEP